MNISIKTWVLACTIAMTSKSFAGLSPADQIKIENSLKIYNSLNNKMIDESLAATVSHSDIGFLTTSSTSEVKLPKAKLVDGNVFIEGLKIPLRVVDLKNGKFTLNGFTVDFMDGTSVEKQITKIQKILSSKNSSSPLLINLFLPEAHAFVIAPVVKAIYLVGAVVTLGGCYFVSNFPHDHGRSIGPGCLMIAAGWPVVAAGAVVLGGAVLASNAANAAEIPTKYECDKDGGVTVYGSKNKKVKITKAGDGYKSEPPNKNADNAAYGAAAATLRATCSLAPEGISKLNTVVDENKSRTGQKSLSESLDSTGSTVGTGKR